MQQLIRRGLVALDDVKDIAGGFFDLGLLHLADLQTAEHLIGVVTVTSSHPQKQNNRGARLGPRSSAKQ